MLNSHLWLVTLVLDSADRVLPSWQKVPLHRAAREKVESSLFPPTCMQHGQGSENRREQTQIRAYSLRSARTQPLSWAAMFQRALDSRGSGWASLSSNYSRNRQPQGVERRDLSSLGLPHTSNPRDSLGRLGQPMSACVASKQTQGINIMSHFI